jgi:hypothetical protein
MITLVVAMAADYLLTYTGISCGAISEGNPMMVWLMQMPFAAGLAIRLCMIAALCGALLLARKRKYYKRMMIWLTGAYSLVFILHGIWIGRVVI